MPGNPIQYTSRTYATVLADINSDPLLVDKPDWFKRLIAGIMDVLSVIENASANQAFLRTAFTRKAVNDLAAMLDYYPAGQTESSGILMFDISASTGLPYTVAQADVAALYPGSLSNSLRKFEARGSLAFVATNYADPEPAANWVVGTSIVTTAANPGVTYVTGEKVRLTTSGTLPTGFALNTDYFVLLVTAGAGPTANQLKLYPTRAGAMAGGAGFIAFSTQGTGTHTITRLSRPITAYSQTTVPSFQLGVSDGTPWQEFRIAQTGVLKSVITITNSQGTWTRVDTPVYNIGTDLVFRLISNTDGSSTIRFGDGTYGAIPTQNQPINATYAWGGGAAANITTLGAISQYAGADANITGVYNATVFSGAAEYESIQTTKVLAPLLLKARDRFVTVGDGIALTLAWGSVGGTSISQAQVIQNAYGILSCAVVAVAAGTQGPLTAPQQAALQTYLISKTIMQAVNVVVIPGTFSLTLISANIHLSAGYTWASVLPYATLAFQLITSAAGQDIVNTYKGTGGIVSAIALINSIFSTGFGPADYTTVAAIINGLSAAGVRQFGDLIELSTLLELLIAYVPGVSYAVLTAVTIGGVVQTLSASWYYQCATTEILTAGTMTLTQV
jgi:hypothetical protein